MNNNENHSIMLSQIASCVEDFAKSEEATTLMCVLRLLIAYHDAKVGELYRALEQEEEKNK
jgi:hypothetical protein